MAFQWRNNGEPVDGEYIVDVDPEDGSQVQTFKGATFKEAADKLAGAQVHASRRINELKRGQTPDPKKPRPSFSPKPLTGDERFQASQDLRDPNKLTDVISQVVESQLGAPLEEVRERLQRADDKEVEDAAITETLAFFNATPEWHPYVSAENKLKLWGYLQSHNMATTAKNFGIAFDRLMESGSLAKNPEEVDEAPEPVTERIVPQQTSRPRGSFSTGIRSSDVSGTSGATKSKPKYTRQDILTMPKSVYAHKLNNEAGFAAVVDALG